MPKPPIRKVKGMLGQTPTTSSLCAGMELDEGIQIERRPTTAAVRKALKFDEVKAKGVPDYSTFKPKHVWGIFKPLCNVANKDVIIFTWNIQHPSIMQDYLINGLCKARRVRLLVGYNRQEHALDKLTQTLRDYQSLGFQVRALPGMHAKLWIVDDRAWVGSCNFVPNTIHNFMMECPSSKVRHYILHYWNQAYDLRSDTKLELLPQPRSVTEEDGTRDDWWRD